jgi:3-oxoacyl-[acyl-carrier protein] reductase
VAFGYIETRLTQTYEGAVPEIEVGGRRHKVGVAAVQSDAMEAMIPLGRKGTPEEAAGAVYLFCIPESDYVTGEIVTVSGGLRA